LTVVAFYPHGAAVCLCIYFRVRGKGRRKLSDCLETRLCLCSFLISTPNLHTTDRLWILFQVWVLLMNFVSSLSASRVVRAANELWMKLWRWKNRQWVHWDCSGLVCGHQNHWDSE
jgi:hypothetical protein